MSALPDELPPMPEGGVYRGTKWSPGYACIYATYPVVPKPNSEWIVSLGAVTPRGWPGMYYAEIIDPNAPVTAKPLLSGYSKEWFEKSADIEGIADVGAGGTTRTPRTDMMVTGNRDPRADEYEDLAMFCRQIERESAMWEKTANDRSQEATMWCRKKMDAETEVAALKREVIRRTIEETDDQEYCVFPVAVTDGWQAEASRLREFKNAVEALYSAFPGFEEALGHLVESEALDSAPGPA